MTETSAPDDDGLTLIELVVVIMLLGILALAIGNIFANSWKAQNVVTTTTNATNAGQLVGQSIERAVRNGQALMVTDGGTKLWVRTAYTDSRQCQVFWVGADKKLNMASAASGAALGSRGTWAGSTTQVNSSTPFFNLTSGDTVAYAFKLGTAGSPVTIAGTESLRTAAGGGAPCWS